MTTHDTSTAALIDALARANRSGELLSDGSVVPPVDFAAAMVVQAASVALTGETTGGWKVGFAADGAPIGGVIFAAKMVASGASWPMPTGGAVLIEVEIAVRLGRDLPHRPGNPYSRADVEAAVSHVVAGIELLRSRMAEQPAPAFTAWLADRLGNLGYVTGAEVPFDPAMDLSALQCRMWIDGTLQHDKAGGHPQNDPLAPVVAYANHAGGFRAGQVVTTGSLIVPLRCEKPCLIEAEIAGIGKVALRLA